MTISENKVFSATLDDFYATTKKAKTINAELWDSHNILTRVFKLFVYQNLRDGVWDEVFHDYLADRYPVGSKGRKGRESNLPRDLWKGDDYTWYNFKLGLQVLTYAFKHIDVQITLDADKARSWVFNVNIMTEDADGVPPLTLDNGLIVSKETVRPDNEPPLVKIVRDLLFIGEHTKATLRERVSLAYPELPKTNLHNRRGSFIQSVARGNITWDSALQILKVLGVNGLTVAIKASHQGEAFNTTQAMRLV